MVWLWIWVLQKQKKYPGAIIKFEQTLKINPYHSRSYYNLGRIYWIQKNFDKAEYYFKKAIENNPENYYRKE